MIRSLIEWVAWRLLFWASRYLFPVVDIYAPGPGDNPEVKAVILCDDDYTLNKILRGYANPDAEEEN